MILRKFFSLFFGLLFIPFGYSQALNGTYTIGGVAPDYPTLLSASVALDTNGVSGPVTFLIRSGTYNEQITFYNINGSSATNKVVFTSETGDSSDVIIEHLHQNSANNFTVRFMGTDNIKFSHLTLRAILPATGTPLLGVFDSGPGNDAHNISIKNCKIGTSTLVYGTNQFLIDFNGYSNQTNHDDIEITNNLMIGGDRALNISSDDGTISYNWTISGNTFLNQKNRGITLTEGSDLYIEDNEFVSSTQYTIGYIGMTLTDDYSLAYISRNYFDISGPGTAVSMSNYLAGPVGEVVVKNNIVNVDNTTNSGYVSAFNVSGRPKVKLLSNTTNLSNPSGGIYNTSFYLPSNDTIVVKNNISVTNFITGFIYWTSNFDSLDIDYNNIVKNGTDSIALINQTVYSTMTNLQTSLGLEMNSYSTPPNFIGAYQAVPTVLSCYDNGVPLSDVLIDFFGTPRSSTSPDIGAYEGTVPILEAGFSNSNISITGYCPGDSADIYVRFTNYGLDTITQVNINFNGSVMNLTDTVNPSSLSDSILLGPVYVPSTSNFVAPPIFLSLPNGAVDPDASNDTIFATIYPSMSGVYTVGGGASDFTSLNEAALLLNSNGMCGPVVLNILDGSYDEQVEFNSIPGNSAQNTLTIQSLSQDSSLVSLSYSLPSWATSFSPICKVIDVDYITFMHLGFDSPIYASGKLIEFQGECDSVKISNCLFETTGVSFENSTSSQSEGVRIEKNRFNGGPDQIIIDGNSIVSTTGVIIQNNVFIGVNPSKSINFIHVEDFRIDNNDFSGVFATKFLAIDSCQGPIWMTNNTFNTTGQSYPISLSNLNGDTTSRVQIHNNMIKCPNNTFELKACDFVDFYHNTINSNGGFSLIFSGQNTNTNVKNNILHSSFGGTLMKFYTPIDVSGIDVDYNGLDALGVNSITVGTQAMTLTTFQSFYQKQMNSAEQPVVFVSNTDLHLNQSYFYDNTGTSIPSVTLDIDGEVRDLQNPDMGADEFDMDFSLITDNIKLNKIVKPDTNVCLIQDSMIIEVVNNSTSIVDSVLVIAQLYGTVLDSFYVVQSMNPTDTIQVFVGTFDFNVNTNYDLNFSVALPIGQVDQYPVDNTLQLDYSYIDNCKIHAKPIDDCLTDTQLSVKNFPRHSVTWSTGETTPSIVVSTPGSYSVTVLFNNGCSVTDTYIVN